MGPPSVTSQLWHQVLTALYHSLLPSVIGSADHQRAGPSYCLRSYSEPQLGVETEVIGVTEALNNLREGTDA
jgi:hypothetical protein